MKKAIVEIQVSDDFEKWNCNSCPLATWDECMDTFVCAYISDECPIVTISEMENVN